MEDEWARILRAVRCGDTTALGRAVTLSRRLERRSELVDAVRRRPGHWPREALEPLVDAVYDDHSAVANKRPGGALVEDDVIVYGLQELPDHQHASTFVCLDGRECEVRGQVREVVAGMPDNVAVYLSFWRRAAIPLHRGGMEAILHTLRSYWHPSPIHDWRLWLSGVTDKGIPDE